MTRARFVAGDAQTAARLMAAIRHAAFPEQWQSAWSDELRHIKSRVENERAAPGAKASGAKASGVKTGGKTSASGSRVCASGGEVYDVKLGPGGLSDIEWCAQWLALKNGARLPALQTPNTLRQVEAARGAELLSPAEANALRDAYTFLRRAELRLQITQEHAGRALRHGTPEWTSWARSIFPDEPDQAAARFETEWRANTQAARAVMERVRDEL